jgi:hypothetical protein
VGIDVSKKLLGTGIGYGQRITRFVVFAAGVLLGMVATEEVMRQVDYTKEYGRISRDGAEGYYFRKSRMGTTWGYTPEGYYGTDSFSEVYLTVAPLPGHKLTYSRDASISPTSRGPYRVRFQLPEEDLLVEERDLNYDGIPDVRFVFLHSRDSRYYYADYSCDGEIDLMVQRRDGVERTWVLIDSGFLPVEVENGSFVIVGDDGNDIVDWDWTQSRWSRTPREENGFVGGNAGR